MVNDQELLDDIFGPGGGEGAKSAKKDQVPPVDDVVGADGRIKAPVGPVVKTPVTQKVAVKKVPVPPPVKKVDPGASPYTSGYGGQAFPIGMREIGTDSVMQSGIKAFDEKRLEDALNYFEMVLRNDKGNAEALFFRNKTRERLGLNAVEKPKEERILTREESLSSGGVYRPHTPAADTPGGHGVYRVPTAEHDARWHELARQSEGIDPGMMKMALVIITILVVGLGVTAYMFL